MRRIRIAIAAMLLGCCAAHAEDRLPTIAVFPFELEDKSAGAGIIAIDDRDRRYLAEATEQASVLLRATGRFTVVEASARHDEASHGLRNCDGCESALAHDLGASFSLFGVVTRVNRTEHTLFIRVFDTGTGKLASRGFTNLRMGANYAWPRSAKWLMDNQILAAAKTAN
ncbi:DUF3280 domain-containing protein [Pseudomonas sp. R2.Fl]|nr:DUF3280 domain-containing protein [Pseudomonas sp. R2.Fl]